MHMAYLQIVVGPISHPKVIRAADMPKGVVLVAGQDAVAEDAPLLNAPPDASPHTCIPFSASHAMTASVPVTTGRSDMMASS